MNGITKFFALTTIAATLASNAAAAQDVGPTTVVGAPLNYSDEQCKIERSTPSLVQISTEMVKLASTLTGRQYFNDVVAVNASPAEMTGIYCDVRWYCTGNREATFAATLPATQSRTEINYPTASLNGN